MGPAVHSSGAQAGTPGDASTVQRQDADAQNAAAVGFWGASGSSCISNGADAPRPGVAFDGPPAKRKKQHVEETTLPVTFHDLREKHPPENPDVLARQWPSLKALSNAQAFKFDPGPMPFRQARWLLWERLSCCGVLVKAFYEHSQWWDEETQQPSNATSFSGSECQEVIKSKFGTILWMTTTHRVYNTSGGEAMTSRLQKVLQAFNPVNDAPDGFHGASLPKSVRSQGGRLFR
jgi:hypothetical protein